MWKIWLVLPFLFILAACDVRVQRFYEYEEPLSLYEIPPLAMRTRPPTPPSPAVYDEMVYLKADFPSLHINIPLHPFEQERGDWQRGGLLAMEGTSPELAFYDVPVRIRGRGNTTWNYGPDKRPLRIRFEEAQTILDSPYAHRDWVLLANHFDRSLLRNHGAKYLSRLLTGMHWNAFGRFVHLYINGEYYGVYELIDERSVEPGRVNLTAHEDPQNSEYFLELNGHTIGWRRHDFVYGEDFFIVTDRAYELRFPSGAMASDAHFLYARNHVQRVSDAIRTHNWRDITNLIGLASFVDFYIVQELFKNADIGAFGVFMQISGQGEDRRLYLGPVWDFDQSSGNNEFIENPRGRFAVRENYWFNYLMNIPAFKEAVTLRWDEIKYTYIPQMLERIMYLATTYEHAFERNFERHPYVMGDIFEWNWVHSYATAEIDTFMGQVEFLIDFLEQRMEWMDDFFHDRLVDEEYDEYD